MSRPVHGFTLVEVMIVMILAGFVVLGLVGFYIGSQGAWLDASSQALAQRDATAIIEGIAKEGRSARSVVLNTSCSTEADTMVVFLDNSLTPYKSFWWSNTDSLIHEGPGTCTDRGAVAASKVEHFTVAYDNTLQLFRILLLQVRSSTGQRVEMESSFVMYNAQ